jgi:hypothetical protein
MNDDELRQALDAMRDLMISVATGGPRIGDVQLRFRRMHAEVAEALRARGTIPALPDADLWAWHGRWSSGDICRPTPRGSPSSATCSGRC